jgi:NADPH-dependent curcumin reductase CurA
MPVVKNGTVYYASHPAGKIQPGITVKYVEEEIDLDNTHLNGGVLVKVLALSSDPYMRYRMRPPESTHAVFCPPLVLGQPYVCYQLSCKATSDLTSAIQCRQRWSWESDPQRRPKLQARRLSTGILKYGAHLILFLHMVPDLVPAFQQYSIFPGPPEYQHALKYLRKLEKHPGIPASVYTGTLGTAGVSAFAAFDAFASEKAKENKTIFVSGAAGPVGT